MREWQLVKSQETLMSSENECGGSEEVEKFSLSVQRMISLIPPALIILTELHNLAELISLFQHFLFYSCIKFIVKFRPLFSSILSVSNKTKVISVCLCYRLV